MAFSIVSVYVKAADTLFRARRDERFGVQYLASTMTQSRTAVPTMSSMRAVLNGEKKNIHLPHWTGFVSWDCSLLINQIHENDLTLAIELDSLRRVLTIGCWGHIPNTRSFGVTYIDFFLIRSPFQRRSSQYCRERAWIQLRQDCPIR